MYGIDRVFPFTRHKIGLPYDLTSQSHLNLRVFSLTSVIGLIKKKLAVNFSKDCKSIFKTGHKETCRLPVLVISIRSRFLQPYCSEILSCSKIVTSWDFQEHSVLTESFRNFFLAIQMYLIAGVKWQFILSDSSFWQFWLIYIFIALSLGKLSCWGMVGLHNIYVVFSWRKKKTRKNW